MRRARGPFWLDGGYDRECVEGCPHHPLHKWRTFRLGDVLVPSYFQSYPERADERLTICVACYVPRCGTTGDEDRCVLPRHHPEDHVLESGRREPLGGLAAPA